MSLVEWIVVIVACIFIVAIGYAGVTGKSFFSYKNNHKHNHKSNHQ